MVLCLTSELSYFSFPLTRSLARRYDGIYSLRSRVHFLHIQVVCTSLSPPSNSLFFRVLPSLPPIPELHTLFDLFMMWSGLFPYLKQLMSILPPCCSPQRARSGFANCTTRAHPPPFSSPFPTGFRVLRFPFPSPSPRGDTSPSVGDRPAPWPLTKAQARACPPSLFSLFPERNRVFIKPPS